MVRAVRGAIGIEGNSEEGIHAGAVTLLREMLERNRIREDQIISVLFSLTRDLTTGNPATGLRAAGFRDTPLFCVQEAEVEGSWPRIIRVLLTYNGDGRRPSVPVYLGSARCLRPDLQEDLRE